MTAEIKDLVHIGVNAELKYFVTVKDETLKNAVRLVEETSNFQNLEDEIDVENFASVVDQINSLVIYGEDKDKPETFLENAKPKKRFFGIKIGGVFSTLGFILGGVLVGLSSLPDHKVLYLLLCIGVPAVFVAIGFLLIKGYVKIPNSFVSYPNDLENKSDDYTLEIVGSGLVQMFFEDTSDEDGKAKAKYLLGLEKNPVDEVIYLTHFVSLSELKGIFLCDPVTEDRKSTNLVSPLRRKLLHSTFGHEVLGIGIGLGSVSIILGLLNLFQ